MWLDEAVLSGWVHQEKSGRRGASRTYSDAAIEAILVLKAVYGLPLRGAQGFVQSVLGLMGLSLPVPHFSTLSRRQVGLALEMPNRKNGQALHLVVDSTGCKVGCPLGGAKASGRCACMERVRGAPGANCIWAWMNKRARSWRRCSAATT